MLWLIDDFDNICRNIALWRIGNIHNMYTNTLYPAFDKSFVSMGVRGGLWFFEISRYWGNSYLTTDYSTGQYVLFTLIVDIQREAGHRTGWHEGH